ncbi:MAG: hypothetical protein ACJZ14_01375 [Candidatus Neomarinimicrobiota bacterium]
MIKKILFNISITLPIAFSSINAQDADPIEAARQAKLAAEKAAADAEAATGAAIEAAAAKAAAEAREKVIADREAEKARKLAEKEAAENAEIDAAAEAAAIEARRKLAAELGLELEEVPDSSVDAAVMEDMSVSENSDEEASNKGPLSGFNFGLTGSAGFINGAYITNLPIGGSFIITTPLGFKLGNSLDFTVSIALGTYNAEAANSPIEALLYGIGGNLTIKDLVFTENQIGIIGEGFGIRSFSGISLKRLMKKGLNLPVNILIGAEGFITSNANTVFDEYGTEMTNASYWGGIGVRIDYGF